MKKPKSSMRHLIYEIRMHGVSDEEANELFRMAAELEKANEEIKELEKPWYVKLKNRLLGERK